MKNLTLYYTSASQRRCFSLLFLIPFTFPKLHHKYRVEVLHWYQSPKIDVSSSKEITYLQTHQQLINQAVHSCAQFFLQYSRKSPLKNNPKKYHEDLLVYERQTK